MLPGSILKQLSISRAERGRPLHFGTYYKNTLVALCHALEDSVASTSSEPLVIAAFQLGQWYVEEAERYRGLADRACNTTILATAGSGFGDGKTEQHPNISLVALDSTDPVAQEWHLAILSPTYQAMVLCQELTDEDYGPDGPPEVDLERKFYGLWTFESELVIEAVGLLINKVDQYNAPLASQLRDQMIAIADAIPHATRDNPGEIVARVVNYLEQTHDAQEPAVTAGDLAATELDHNLVSNELQAMLRLAELVDLNDPDNPNGAAQTATLCEAMGELLDLPAWQLKRLRLAALLHRISMLQPDQSHLTAVNDPKLSCPLHPGAQILRSMPRLRAVAQIVNHLGEYWDGTGGPAGLAGDAIPLESRMLSLVTHFQQQLAGLDPVEQRSRLDEILPLYQQQAAGRWDPKLVEILTLVLRGMQQGWSLPSVPVKVAAGIWLLDDDDRAAAVDVLVPAP